MIYVTHDQVEAMTMGTRICIMNQGRVAQVGPPLEVYRCPADTFVARFLGSPGMNLIESAITEHPDGGPALRLGAALNRLDRARYPDLVPGRRVVFGIRPEDLYEPGGHAPGISTQRLPVEVAAIEPLGAETLLILDLDGADQEIVARISRDAQASVGDRLEIRLDPAGVRLFDAASGKAIEATPILSPETA
jgi:multiple sugar transport system ATP-binding protein